jgi:hypothetical protein
MQKERIVSLINRYHLAGNTDSVKLIIKDNQLVCSFISSNQNVIGEVVLDSVDIEDAELAVYTTSQLLKMLSVLDSEIDIKLVKVDQKVFSLIISDSNTSITYMLSDLSVIKAVPKIKALPSFDVKIDITKEFSDKFLKAKNGMPEAENFAVTSDGTNSEVLLNYSTVNTNRIKFSVNAESEGKLSPTCFSANIFKEILNSNKGAETGIFEVSGQGLARATFTGKDFKSTYYLVQLSIQ